MWSFCISYHGRLYNWGHSQAACHICGTLSPGCDLATIMAWATPALSHPRRRLRRRADTLVVVGRSSTRTHHLFKVHDNIVTKHLALRHNVEVVAVTVLVGATTKDESVSSQSTYKRQTEKGRGKGDGSISPDLGTPLRIPIIRTQIRHHDRDTLPARPTRAARRAGSGPGARQFVARPAADAAPRRTRRVKKGL